MFDFFVRRIHHRLHIFGQVAPGFGCNVVGYAVKRFSDAACNGRDGVAVAAQ